MAVFKEMLRNDGSGITRFYRIDNGSITTLDYDALMNKPKINGKELIGDILIDISDFDLSNYYTKKETNTTIQTKLADYYTKKETDNQITKRIEEVSAPDVDLTDYYTKAETEALVTEKIEEATGQDIDLTNYYTKTETETLVEEKIGEIVIPEVDLTGYYTKTETEVLIDEKIDGIEIPTTDLSNYYNKEETEAKIDEKINAIPVNDLLHDIGHFATKDDLPSTGQLSGTQIATNMTHTGLTNYKTVDKTYNADTSWVKSLKNSGKYWLIYCNHNTNGLGFSTNYPDMIKIGIANNYTSASPTWIFVVDYDPAKPVYMAGFGSSVGDYHQLTADGKTSMTATISTAQLVTKKSVFYMSTGTYSSSVLATNSNNAMFGNFPQLKFIDSDNLPYQPEVSTYNYGFRYAVNSFTTPNLSGANFTYNNGMTLFKFNENEQARFMFNEAVAKVNQIATVGENNNLYKCYEGPVWKKVGGGTDTYSKEEIDAMIGDINTVLTEIVEGGE